MGDHITIQPNQWYETNRYRSWNLTPWTAATADGNTVTYYAFTIVANITVAEIDAIHSAVNSTSFTTTDGTAGRKG